MPTGHTEEVEYAWGAGRLLTREGEWVADVLYDLRLYQEMLEDGAHGRERRTTPGLKSGRGWLRCAPDSVVDFSQHVESVLELEKDDGRTTDIVISNPSATDSTCVFETSGARRDAP